MKLCEYIAALQEIEMAHGGDIEVEKDSPFSGRHSAGIPEVSYTLVLKGRENKPRFWSRWYSEHTEDRKGAKVVQV